MSCDFCDCDGSDEVQGCLDCSLSVCQDCSIMVTGGDLICPDCMSDEDKDDWEED